MEPNPSQHPWPLLLASIVDTPPQWPAWLEQKYGAPFFLNLIGPPLFPPSIPCASQRQIGTSEATFSIYQLNATGKLSFNLLCENGIYWKSGISHNFPVVVTGHAPWEREGARPATDLHSRWAKIPSGHPCGWQHDICVVYIGPVIYTFRLWLENSG